MAGGWVVRMVLTRVGLRAGRIVLMRVGLRDVEIAVSWFN